MLSVGMKTGVYEVTAALGADGMGEVYRTRDTRLGRYVALKFCPPSLHRILPGECVVNAKSAG
jgi:serine/threonine protein kinase